MRGSATVNYVSGESGVASQRIFKQAGLSTLIIGLGLATSVFRVVFLTRSLSINDYGILSVLLTTMMVLSYLFSLGAFQYVYKETAASELHISALKSVIVGVWITSLFWTLVGTLLSPLLLKSGVLGFGLLEWELTLTASALSAILFVLIYFLYGQRQVVFYNLLLFLRGYAWLYILVPPVLLFKARLTVTWVAASWVMLIVIALFLAVRRIGFSHLKEAPIEISWFRCSIKYGAPLLPFFLSVWGMLAISKYILAYVCNNTQVALFSLAYTIFDMVYLVAVSISQALSPYVFADWKGGNQSSVHFDVALKYSTLLAILLTLEALLVGEQLIQLLAGEVYVSASAFMPFMAPLPLLHVLSANIEQRLMATNRTQQMGIIYVIGLLCTLVVGLSLGRVWEVYGVIAALLFARIVLLAMMIWKVRGEIKIDGKFVSFYRIFVSSIFLVFLTFLWMTIPLLQQFQYILAIAMPGIYFFILYTWKAISRSEVACIMLVFGRIVGQIKRLIPYRGEGHNV